MTNKKFLQLKKKLKSKNLKSNQFKKFNRKITRIKNKNKNKMIKRLKNKKILTLFLLKIIKLHLIKTYPKLRRLLKKNKLNNNQNKDQENQSLIYLLNQLVHL